MVCKYNFHSLFFPFFLLRKKKESEGEKKEMRFIFFIIAIKIKKYPLPCKYLLQKIYNLTKLSLSIFAQKFTEIDLEPPNLFFIHKVCNVCTKFKKDLVICKKNSGA
jgi:hypothetical protein